MSGFDLKHVLAAAAAVVVLYNGHAGLAEAAYEHNQSDLEFARAPGFSIDIGTSETFTGGSAPRLMADMGGQFYA